MADRNDSDRKRSASGRSGKNRDQNGEWVRDQVGDDRNLSGSSTYRTLPDQPESSSDDLDERGAKDAKDRQSNR